MKTKTLIQLAPLPERKKRAAKILAALAKTYPDAHCELDHANALQLLVATILSAQCTDARVNIVTKDLFKKYRTAEDFTHAPRKELEAAIRSTGFYRNKAKSVQGACEQIATLHGGRVPNTMEELLKLPGVARKTANVVLGTAFGIPSGIVVDTHVTRLSQRMGFTAENNPVKIERELMELFPTEGWILASHRLIWHGRRVCKAISPNCGGCSVKDLCPSAFSFGKEEKK